MRLAATLVALYLAATLCTTLYAASSKLRHNDSRAALARPVAPLGCTGQLRNPYEQVKSSERRSVKSEVGVVARSLHSCTSSLGTVLSRQLRRFYTLGRPKRGRGSDETEKPKKAGHNNHFRLLCKWHKSPIGYRNVGL